MSAKEGSPGAAAQQQQVAEADHRGQQIVEVVRDAAGQLADRLHLLRLGELDFEALLLGHVDEMQGERLFAGRATVEAIGEQHQPALVRPRDPNFDRFAVLLPRQRRGEFGSDVVTPLVVEEIDQLFSDQVRQRPVEQLADRTVCFDEAARCVEHRDPDRRIREEPPEAAARRPGRGLRAALGRLLADRPGAAASVSSDRGHRDPARGENRARLPARRGVEAQPAKFGRGVRIVGRDAGDAVERRLARFAKHPVEGEVGEDGPAVGCYDQLRLGRHVEGLGQDIEIRGEAGMHPAGGEGDGADDRHEPDHAGRHRRAGLARNHPGRVECREAGDRCADRRPTRQPADRPCRVEASAPARDESHAFDFGDHGCSPSDHDSASRYHEWYMVCQIPFIRRRRQNLRERRQRYSRADICTYLPL